MEGLYLGNKYQHIWTITHSFCNHLKMFSKCHFSVGNVNISEFVDAVKQNKKWMFQLNYETEIKNLVHNIFGSV